MHRVFETMLTKFHEGVIGNQWLHSADMNVYVRRGYHTLPPLRAIRNAFDVANVEVIELRRGRGIFTEWLAVAERLASEYGFDAVFVESVLNPRLGEFLIRQGYTKMGPDQCPNYFKYCDHLTQKASLASAL